jgi:hypothetical protein
VLFRWLGGGGGIDKKPVEQGNDNVKLSAKENASPRDHGKENMPASQHGQEVDVSATGNKDWRKEIMGYIQNPSGTRDRKIHRQALKYTMMDDTLYR